MVDETLMRRDLRLVEDCLFEILWRPLGMTDGCYRHLVFADQFAMTELGKWLTARADDYAVLTEKSGRAAYLRIRDQGLMRLLLLKLGQAAPSA